MEYYEPRIIHGGKGRYGQYHKSIGDSKVQKVQLIPSLKPPDIYLNGIKMFQSQDVFYQFHTEGFELPSGCELLAKGDFFSNQAFKYKNCYGLQFHPEVNIYLHLKWLFLVLIKKPHILFKNGAQNIFYQLWLRIKYNNSISKWLDDFLDNYLLKEQ